MSLKSAGNLAVRGQPVIAAFLKSSKDEFSGMVTENEVSVDNLNVTFIVVVVSVLWMREYLKQVGERQSKEGRGKAKSLLKAGIRKLTINLTFDYFDKYVVGINAEFTSRSFRLLEFRKCSPTVR